MNIRQGLHLLAFVLPLIAAISLSLVATRHSMTLPGSQWLKPVSVDTLDELERLFTELDYDWPVDGDYQVPRLLIKSIPESLTHAVSVPERKANFLRILLPVVLAENQEIRQQREWLQGCLQQGVSMLDKRVKGQLRQLARSYKN